METIPQHHKDLFLEATPQALQQVASLNQRKARLHLKAKQLEDSKRANLEEQ